MEISFLGGASLKIKTKNLVLLVEPKSSKDKADVVVETSGAGTILSGAINRENTFYVTEEGEYELSGVGVVVYGMETKAGRVLVPLVTVDGVSVVFLAKAGSGFTDSQIEKLAEADVAVVPLATAVSLIEQLAPSVAILAGYENKEEVAAFLSANKFETVKQDSDKLKIDENSLPENTEVVVLNA